MPLIVRFQDEDGIDQGGLRADLLNLLLDSIENAIASDLETYKTDDNEDDTNDDILSKDEAANRLFAYGLFSSIAVVQCGFCQPFILKYYDQLKSHRDHPFIRGLRKLGVPLVIF